MKRWRFFFFWHVQFGLLHLPGPMMLFCLLFLFEPAHLK